jgi:UDP-N-acetylmuramoyl-tripeptide--D-alanyl-D-alanine ligase
VGILRAVSQIKFRLRRAYPIGVAYLLSACAFLWRRLMFRTTFIAISGSVGKSTATASLGAILSAHYPTNWTPGGGNNRRTLAETILRTRFRHRFTVIEVGTRAPGALRRAAWMIAPNVVVMLRVLNIHSNAFPTLEEMAA